MGRSNHVLFVIYYHVGINNNRRFAVEKIWLQHYSEGVPHEIDPNEYSSLIEIFDKSCERFANNIAYENMGVTLTYAKVNEISRNLAAYLQSLKLEKGARVAIMMPNLLQYPISLFAIMRAGYVVVNTNPLYTRDEVIHQLKDAEADVLIVLANFAHVIEKALPEIPSLKKVIVTEIGDLFPPVKRVLVNAVVKYVKKMVPHYSLKDAISFNEVLAIGKKCEFTPCKLTHEDIAFLQYTGGTTGVAKGAVLTHRNMVSNVLQASAWIQPLNTDENDVIVTALPLYHIFSLTANCLTFLNKGTRNILITNPRDIKKFIHEIKNSGFTFITGVNTLYNALLNHPDFKEVDFSRLKVALAGGMALQESVALRWNELTKSNILEAYGLTETSPAVTINPLYMKGYNGSIGLPIPSTDVSIRDDEGKELPIGETGELCIKGPQVMREYWNREGETKKVFWEDGFIRTGDIAKMDEKGFVYIVDRKKDMILVSGFNVYPNEIEQVIALHPGVLEVGVIGIADTESGERVKACIVKKDQNLTEEDVISYCREKLTPYKVPKVVEFYQELPKTNVGKILRRELR